MPDARHKVTPEDYDRARKLRRDMTPPEKLIWYKLRKIPKEYGLNFRRQHPIHVYVVDFICMKLKLIVEIDGGSHATRQKQDSVRDNYLNNQGYTVLRFSNNDALNNPDGVISTILVKIKELKVQEVQCNSSPLEGEVRWGVLSTGTSL